MTHNKLKQNSDKTELILFGSKKHLASFPVSSLSVAGTDVTFPEEPVRNLRAIFDAELSMSSHLKKTVKAATFQLRNIGLVRRRLTASSTRNLVQTLVFSRLDYCNGLLCGIPDKLLSSMQRVQNTAARIISLVPKHQHITPTLIKLHWLPIKAHIDFKVLVTVYKALNGQSPEYIGKMLEEYKPLRSLRSCITQSSSGTTV